MVFNRRFQFRRDTFWFQGWFSKFEKAQIHILSRSWKIGNYRIISRPENFTFSKFFRSLPYNKSKFVNSNSILIPCIDIAWWFIVACWSLPRWVLQQVINSEYYIVKTFQTCFDCTSSTATWLLCWAPHCDTLTMYCCGVVCDTIIIMFRFELRIYN